MSEFFPIAILGFLVLILAAVGVAQVMSRRDPSQD
jgi:hypothetical protein